MPDIGHRPVVEVIENHPRVGEILRDHDIACVDCTEASCMLKDVVSIHNLEPEQAEELARQVAAVLGVDPDEVEMEVSSGPTRSEPSPVIRILNDEHLTIRRLVGLTPAMAEQVDPATVSDRDLLHGAVEFIRAYADRYHHAKEEEELFSLFDQNLEIFQVMRLDHEMARGEVRAIEEATESQDRAAVAEHLSAYHDLLEEHISKEDDVLYPWIDRQLTDHQVGTLFARFRQIENEMAEIRRRSEEFLQKVEQALAVRDGAGRVSGQTPKTN